MVFTRPTVVHRTAPKHRTAGRTFLGLGMAVLFALLIGLSPAAAQTSGPGPSMESAADWLLSLRDDDGAFPGFDGSADPGVTVDAVTALALASRLSDLEPSLTYLESKALVYAQTGPGSAAKLTLMLIAAGQNPRDFATVDPLSIVEHAAAQGMIGFGPYDHALGMLALVAGGSPIPDAAIEAIWSSQGEESGWAFDGSTTAGAADTNTTSLMVRAIVEAGLGEDERVDSAVSWLASLVTADGVPYQPDGPADSNSTSLAIRAFEAFGADQANVDQETLVSSLVAFQNDNGSYSWLLDTRDENIFSTVEAIPALAAVAAVPSASPEVPGSASPEASPAASPEAARIAA